MKTHFGAGHVATSSGGGNRILFKNGSECVACKDFDSNDFRTQVVLVPAQE